VADLQRRASYAAPLTRRFTPGGKPGTMV